MGCKKIAPGVPFDGRISGGGSDPGSPMLAVYLRSGVKNADHRLESGPTESSDIK